MESEGSDQQGISGVATPGSRRLGDRVFAGQRQDRRFAEAAPKGTALPHMPNPYIVKTDAQIVLDEFLDLRVRGIPARLLSEAHGVAVIPNVMAEAIDR